MAGTSRLEVINGALTHLTEDRVAHELESDISRQLDAEYETILQDLLESDDWFWTSDTRRLVRINEESPLSYGWSEYRKDADIMRIVRIYRYRFGRRDSLDYRISNGTIHTIRTDDNTNPDDALMIRAVVRKPETEFPASFTLAFQAKLALKLAPKRAPDQLITIAGLTEALVLKALDNDSKQLGGRMRIQGLDALDIAAFGGAFSDDYSGLGGGLAVSGRYTNGDGGFY